jgi:hypothetical protein
MPVMDASITRIGQSSQGYMEDLGYFFWIRPQFGCSLHEADERGNHDISAARAASFETPEHLNRVSFDPDFLVGFAQGGSQEMRIPAVEAAPRKCDFAPMAGETFGAARIE